MLYYYFNMIFCAEEMQTYYFNLYYLKKYLFVTRDDEMSLNKTILRLFASFENV